MSAHSVCLKSASLGIAPCTVSAFWPAGDAVRTSGGLQRPEHAGLIRVAVVVGHVGLALLFNEHPLRGERMCAQAAAGALNHYLNSVELLQYPGMPCCRRDRFEPSCRLSGAPSGEGQSSALTLRRV